MKKGLHAGNVILIGFGVMVLFMCYLVYQCTQNPSEMVAENYYEQELKYQDLIDAKTNTEAYNDSLTMQKSDGSVSFYIPKQLNDQFENGKVQLYNKANAKKDRSFELKHNTDGLYTIDSKDWGQGNYELKLSLKAGSKEYYKEFPY